MGAAAVLTAAWGLFLASSWTWCIGMYLPVPLLREYGWAGFLAFAIPNLVGCTVFGYLVSRERSRESAYRASFRTIRLTSGRTWTSASSVSACSRCC